MLQKPEFLPVLNRGLIARTVQKTILFNRCGIINIMTNKKLTKKEIEALDAQIKADQEKPVRENERRVRIGANFKDAVKKMAKTSPISNKDLVEWTRKQKKDIE